MSEQGQERTIYKISAYLDKSGISFEERTIEVVWDNTSETWMRGVSFMIEDNALLAVIKQEETNYILKALIYCISQDIYYAKLLLSQSLHDTYTEKEKGMMQLRLGISKDYQILITKIKNLTSGYKE